MDVAGLALSLPGLFTSCIDIFEIIQTGHETATLHLSNAGLRLSRWGESLGLGDPRTQHLQPQFALLEPQAKAILKKILDSLEQAHRSGEKFKPHIPGNGYGQASDHDNNSILGNLQAKMHAWTHHRVVRRQNLTKRVRWAVYEKKALDGVIRNVRVFVDDLIDLFPEARMTQMQLCQEEVEDFARDGDDNMLALLSQVAEDNGDDMLQEAVASKINERADGSSFTDFDIEGRESLRLGVGTHFARGAVVSGPGSKFHGFKIRGAGDLSVGDRYI